jgi:ribosomal protein S27E
MDVKCPSCGSKRILQGGHVVSRVFRGPSPVSVEIPRTAGLRGRMKSSLSAAVCVDCGNIAFRAVDLAELRRAYEAVGKPLGLDT